MDKYRRNDDPNDDLEVYIQEDMHVIQSKTPNQNIREVGRNADSSIDCISNYNQAMLKLSKREKELWTRIQKGQSIRQAARLMGIRQQVAQTYWNRIKEKIR